MKCTDCELCFPANGGVVCAGGDIAPGYFKDYGDMISSEDLEVEHNCLGFHRGLASYLEERGCISKKFKKNGRD